MPHRRRVVVINLVVAAALLIPAGAGAVPATTTGAVQTPVVSDPPATEAATDAATSPAAPATPDAATTPANPATVAETPDTTTATDATPALSAQDEVTPSEVTVDVEPGVYVISSAVAGRVLDVSGGSSADGANVQVWDGNETSAQRWRVERSGVHYRIVNAVDGEVLDVSGGGTRSGTNVQQWRWNGTDSQLWDFVDAGGGTYSIRSVVAGAMLDVAGGSGTNGSNVQIWTGNGTLAQAWRLTSVTRTLTDGAYVVRSSCDSGKVLDVAGGSADSGAKIQTWSDNGSLAQRWKVTYQESSGYYRVESATALGELDVCGGNRARGTAVWQYASNGTASQLWSLVARDDVGGSYELVSALSGLALDVPGANPSDGNGLHVWTRNGTAAQGWTFEVATSFLPSGLYSFRSAVDDAYVIDVSGGSVSPDARIQVWDSNGTLAQKWVVTKLDDTTCTIMSARSGLFLTDDAGTLAQHERDEEENQTWSTSLGGTGGIVLSNVGTGRVIDLSGASARSGNSVGMYLPNDTRAQTWRPVASSVVADGVYVIRALSSAGQVLDVSGGSFAEGSAVQLWADNGTNAQKWRVMNTGDGSYTLTNVRSGDRLDVTDYDITPGSGLQQWLKNDAAAQRWIFSIGEHGGIVARSALGEAYLGTASGSLAGGARACVSGGPTQAWELSPTSYDSFTVTKDLIQSGYERRHDGINLIGGVGSISQEASDQIWSAMQAFWNNGYDAGFVMIDLDDGCGVTFNADNGFYSASTIKAPWCTQLLQLMDAGVVDGGAGGSINDIILYSDNDAYTSTRENYGWTCDNFRNWLDWTGDDGSRLAYDWYEWYSPRDLCKMWNGIRTYFWSSGNGSWLASLTANTNHSPIRDALWWKATVYNKAGWYPMDSGLQADNDSALVYADGHPYLMTIMSSAPAYSGLPAGLANALDRAHLDVMGY